MSKINLYREMRVLDIGCGLDGNSLESEIPDTCEVVGVDLHDPARIRIRQNNFQYIQRDAEDLSIFPDLYFDLAVSVGMMEHICDPEKLRRIASEMIRVSKQSVVVVPWRFAWFEPHFKLPFFQLLPWAAQVRLMRMFNCNGYGESARTNPDRLRAHFLETYQWLPTVGWKGIFRTDTAYLSPTLETLVIVRKSCDPQVPS
jgi:ubiquinone/menaquinone biosynthesis C-methylase UbiE